MFLQVIMMSTQCMELCVFQKILGEQPYVMEDWVTTCGIEHSIWAPTHIPAAPHPNQLSAHDPANAVKDGPRAWIPVLTQETYMEFLVLT